MQNNSKKKNILISALSVVLAATLLFGGGTYAYLQGTTEDVVNDFQTNKVLVDLAETTGSDYSIIPGTSEEKDPTVKVNATIPAYVYVTVTDTTEGLVTYTLADGWTLLDGYDNVYYREVEGSDTEQTFPVLKDNTVYYDAALQNSDMLDADGNLKDGIQLTFQAFAVQKEPFSNAAEAFVLKDAVLSRDEDSLKANLENGGVVALNNHIAITPTGEGVNLYPQMHVTKDTTLNLSGKTLSVQVGDEELSYTPVMISVESGATLIIEGNGTVNAEAGNNNSYGIDVYGGNLIINGGTFYGALTAVQVTTGSVVINGGFFDLAPIPKSAVPQYAKYVVNAIDQSYKDGSATIEIKGGTFVNFDPSANPEGENTSYVADGYHVESAEQANGDIWYTVVKDS